MQHSQIVFKVLLPPHIAVPPGIPVDRVEFLAQARAPKNQLAQNIFWSQRLLRHVANRFPTAVFHSPGPIWGTVMPKRTVVTIHDCIYRTFPNYLGRFVVRRMFMRATERFAGRAPLVLTDSEFSKGDLINRLGLNPERLEILYPWVGNEFLAPTPMHDVENLRERLHLPRHFWLYLGGYDYRKNIEFLLQAYAGAARERTIPPLVLAGAIPTRGSRATCDVSGSLKRLQLSEAQIRMPGRIAGDDLPLLYKAASLLIYPSLMEGFGLPPAEAMAAGTPVLAANSSSLPEVVQQTNSLFNPTDVDSLVRKLLLASEDEAQFLAKLSPAFTESHGIDRYMQLLDRVR